MIEASCCECIPFDPCALLWNGFVTLKVDADGCDVVNVLVIASVIVVIDEGFILRFIVTWQVAVFQQNAVFQGLVPSFDLALGLRMNRARFTGGCNSWVAWSIGNRTTSLTKTDMRAPIQTMIRIIEDHRADHGVEPLCRVLPIAPATLHDRLAN